MPRYFTGKSVESKRLTQASASTFEALITEMINMPALVSVSRERYFSLGPAERNAAKNTSYLVAATFDGSSGVRRLEDAGPCNLLFLDIDTLKDGHSPAAPFVANPKLLRERLRWNFAAYKTISSTEEAPRLRVVVDASDIPVDRYPDAVLTVAHAMGLPKVTRESAVAVQPMYLPSVFQEQDVEKDHPLLTSRFDGDTFVVADILDDSVELPGLVSGGRTTRVQVKGDALEDWLTYFKLPVPSIDLAKANEILSSISADVSRKDWIDMAAGLRHQFPDDEAAAYKLFDDWSSSGTKYVGPEDTLVNWRSLSQQPRGRAPVTIRTMLKLAVEHGWDGSAMREQSFQEVSKWLMFECQSLTQLTFEGIKRIVAAPLLSHTEEGMLLATLRDQLKEKYQQSVQLADLKKDLQRAKDAAFVKKDTDSSSDDRPWRNGWVFVARTKEFFRQCTGETMDIIAFDAANSRWLLPDPEELEKKGSVGAADLITPVCRPSMHVLNHLPRCKVVEDYDYDPSQPEETIIHRDGRTFVNTYRRSYKAADKDLAEHAEELLMDHLCNLIAEPELRTCVLDWMAYNVQHPGHKIRWAILLQGAHGNGKTIISDVMRAVLGNDNIKLINSNTMVKGWSEWAVGAQLVFMEEIRVTGTHRHDVANMLKEPITNKWITINKRNSDTGTRLNRTNYMAFTNFHNAIPIDPNDRRWCVIKSAMQNRAQVADLRARDPLYFNKLHDMCDTHAAGLRHLLENRVISRSFDPNGTAPVTSYMLEMVHDTANELTTVVGQIIADGDNPYVTDEAVALKSMIAAMDAAGVGDVTQYQASQLLREMGYTEAGRHLIGADRQQVWVRKDLLNGRNPVDVAAAIGKDATMEDDWFK